MIAAIYKEAGKQEMYLKQRPEELEKLAEIWNHPAVCKDFGDRFALVETKLSALETVRCAAMDKVGRFTKQDIREMCPSLSVSSVEGALRKLVASGELKREGSGRNACYYRIN